MNDSEDFESDSLDLTLNTSDFIRSYTNVSKYSIVTIPFEQLSVDSSEDSASTYKRFGYERYESLYIHDVIENYVSPYLTTPEIDSFHGYDFNFNYEGIADEDATNPELSIFSASEDPIDIIMECEGLISDAVDDVILRSIKEFGTTLFLMNISNKQFSRSDCSELLCCLEKNICLVKEENAHLVQDLNGVMKYEMDDLPIGEKIENVNYLSFHWTERLANMDRISDVVSLEKDFNSTVRTISKLIILEKNLPNYLKSIKMANVGGKAGGHKYITHGILFKFSTDVRLGKNQWLYGKHTRNDLLALKAINNEIRVLRSLFPFIRKRHIPNFRLPLMSTFSYLGAVICAVSFLPISQNSLCYGTPDGGRTIHVGKDDEYLSSIIGSIKEYYNFADHPVKDDCGNEKIISLAADVEIHKVGNVYYMLDLGRFLPSNDPFHPFVNFFRPEALLKYREETDLPLSCDAFSGFGRIDANTWNRRSIEFFEELNIRMKEKFKADLKLNHLEITLDTLPSVLHSYGFNLRMMGYLRHELTRSNVSSKILSRISVRSSTVLRRAQVPQMILREIILRSIKSIFLIHMNKIMKNHILPIESRCKNGIIELYEKFKLTSDYWKASSFKGIIIKKYPDSLTKEELDPNYHLLESFDKEEQIEIYESIPEYSRFTGGMIHFKTDIFGHIKSCIPMDNIENKIEQILQSDNVTEDDFWDEIDFIHYYGNPELLLHFLNQFYKITKCEYRLAMVSRTIFNNSSQYFEIFQGSFALVLDFIWNICLEDIFYFKAAVLVTVVRYEVKCKQGKLFRKLMKKIFPTAPKIIDLEATMARALYLDYYENHKISIQSLYGEHLDQVVKFLEFFPECKTPLPQSKPFDLSLDIDNENLDDFSEISEIFHTVEPPSLHFRIYRKKTFPNLKKIKIDNQDLENLHFYKHLQELEIVYDGFELNLAMIQNFSDLKILSLSNVSTSDDIWNICGYLKNLTSLDLSQTGTCVPFNGAIGLVNTNKLTYLNISGTNVDDQSLNQLSFIHSIENLVMTDLCFISDSCIKYLARLRNLYRLDISHCSPIHIKKKNTSLSPLSIYFISTLPFIEHLILYGIYLPNLSLYYLSNIPKLRILEVDEDLCYTTLWLKKISLNNVSVRIHEKIISVKNDMISSKEEKFLQNWNPKKKVKKDSKEYSSWRIISEMMKQSLIHTLSLIYLPHSTLKDKKTIVKSLFPGKSSGMINFLSFGHPYTISKVKIETCENIELFPYYILIFSLADPHCKEEIDSLLNERNLRQVLLLGYLDPNNNKRYRKTIQYFIEQKELAFLEIAHPLTHQTMLLVQENIFRLHSKLL